MFGRNTTAVNLLQIVASINLPNCHKIFFYSLHYPSETPGRIITQVYRQIVYLEIASLASEEYFDRNTNY